MLAAVARGSSRRAAAAGAPAVAARLSARSHATGPAHASASRSVPTAWLSASQLQAGAGADQRPSVPLSLLSVHREGLPFIFVPSLAAAPPCVQSSNGGAPVELPMEAAQLLGWQGEGGFGGAMTAFDWGVSVGEAADVEELQVLPHASLEEHTSDEAFP